MRHILILSQYTHSLNSHPTHLTTKLLVVNKIVYTFIVGSTDHTQLKLLL